MNYKLDEIFDIEELRSICESFTELTGTVTAILDLEGNVHVSTDWQSICTQFHRCNKETSMLCTESDTILSKDLKEGKKYSIYKCKNGLIDVAIPIIINNIHIGNFFTGQFLTEKPDTEYFRKQAKRYGFDEQKYFTALDKVPVFSNKQIEKNIQFLVRLTETIGNIGFRNLENIEINRQIKKADEIQRAANQQLGANEQQLRAANQQLTAFNQQLSANEQQLKAVIQELAKSEEKLRNIFENSTNAFYSHTPDHVLTYLSPQVKDILGYTQEEAMIKWTELVSDNPINEIGFQYTVKAIETGKRQPQYDLELVKKSGEKIWIEVREYPMVENGKTVAIVGSLADITERKRTEDALRKSNEKHRTILKTAIDGFWITNKKGDLLEVNDAYCHMSGYSKEELLSMTISELDVKDSKKEVISRINKIQKEGSDRFESIHRKKDNTIYPVKINIQYHSFEEGQFIVFIEDITERKKAELELLAKNEELIKAKDKAEEMNQRFNLAIKATSDGLWDRNLITNGIYFSPRWKSILGYNDNELPNEFSVFEKLTKDDDVKQASKMLTELIEGKRDRYTIELQMQHKKGHWVDILSRANVFYDDENKPYRIVGTHTDISERKKREKQLKQSEERFRKLIEKMPNGLAIYKPVNNGEDFEFIDINKKAEIITRSSKEELLGHTLSEKFPNMIKSPLIKNLRKINKDGKELYIPPFYYKDEQREGWRENYIYKLQTGEIVVIFKDVTELKESEENLKLKNNELIKAKNKAVESDQLKSAFLANMSHEIRTPMNGILGFTELLKEPELSGEERDKFVEIIRKSGDRMLSTVNDIIDISKIDAGQVEISKADVNINLEIGSLFEFFIGEASAKGLKIELINDLPKQSIIVTDKPKLDSVISNLIKNAIKYTDKGSIEIHCTKDGANLAFSVTDTGIGIPKNRIQSIFNRFEQADISDTYAREGSGLGLSITKAYVKMLGGHIGVESKMGKGSTFYFTLPWIEKQEKPEHINEKKERNTANGNQINILIAEDDDISFQHLKIILNNTAKNIDRVENGKDAVDYMKKDNDIHLILMDAKMPLMDGYEATAKIRKFNTDVIIIAQTAYALEGDEEKAIAAGCNDYIAKPINKAALLKMINKNFLKKINENA